MDPNDPKNVPNGDARAQPVNGHPRAIVPPPAVEHNRLAQRYAEDRLRAMELIRLGRFYVERQRFTFVVGMVFNQLMDQVRRNEVVAEEEDPLEVARGPDNGNDLDVAAIEPEPLVEEPVAVEEDRRTRNLKRKMGADVRDAFYQPALKRKKVTRNLRFSRRVEVQLTSRVLAINRRRPYVMSGSPIGQTVGVLKRPSAVVKPPVISLSEIDRLAATTSADDIRFMENPRTDRSCSSTCDGGVCGESCLCRVLGVNCAPFFGCQCDPTRCSNWKHGPITQMEHLQNVMAALKLANEVYEDWPMRDDSTLSSVGSLNLDDAMSGGSEVGDEDDMAPPPDIQDVDDADDAQNSDDDAVPLIPNIPSPSPPASPDRSSSSDDSSSSSDDDSDDDDPQVSVDLLPRHFSPFMIRRLPAILDQQEEDTCLPGRYLGGDAIFVGLMRVATQYNVANHGTGKRCAVMHPNVFQEADRLAGEDEDERQKRLLAGNRQRAPLLELDSDFVADFTIYGNEWTDLLIPMLINGNHWSVAVVRRSLVKATIYDSLDNPSSKAQSIAAIRKILEALGGLIVDDRSTGRFKVKFALKKSRDVQTDGSSCGLFVIHHARRAIERTNANASTRTGDLPINVLQERRELKDEIAALRALFTLLEAQRTPLDHRMEAPLPCTPGKALLTLNYVKSKY